MKIRRIQVAIFASMSLVAYDAENTSQAPAVKSSKSTTVGMPESSPSVVKNIPQPKSTKKSRTEKKSKRAAHASQLPKGDLIDDIEVIIYGEEDLRPDAKSRVQLITKSDFERSSIDGQPRTKDGVILERLMYLDAQKFGMVQSDDAVDNYLNNIQREQGMTKEQLEQLFMASGYTYEEAREQLRILYAANSIVDFKIRSRLIVPEQDVIVYYKAHPILLEPTYSIQRAVVAAPSEGVDAIKFKKDLEQWCATGEGTFAPAWQEPFWIDKSDLADNKKFITTMHVGSCATAGTVVDGIELFKLVNKKDEREQPLEERYVEIVDVLRRPKYEELFTEYKKQLLDSASIIYL